MKIRHGTGDRVYTAAWIGLSAGSSLSLGHTRAYHAVHWNVEAERGEVEVQSGFAPDGTRHLDLTYADGQTLKASLSWSDGKEVSVTASQGFENATAVSKIQGRTFNNTWRHSRKIIEKVHAAVSPDGRILRITGRKRRTGPCFP